MKVVPGLTASIACYFALTPILSPVAAREAPRLAESERPAVATASSKASSSSSPAKAPAPPPPPSSSAPPAIPAPVNPHAASPQAAEPSPADLRALNATLVTGSPFTDAAHRQQANLARSGRKFQPESSNQSVRMVPSGTVVVLVADGENRPLAGKKVTLKVTRQSIATGDQLSELQATTNAQGLAHFQKLSNETSFRYEAVHREGEATYPSGGFRLEQDFGQMVKLVVYPSASDINETFVVSRALYVIEPREDVFQIQCLLRVHNTNPVTWLPGGLDIQLPKEWQAFTPGETTGDLRVRQTENRVVIDGSFTPGQHDFGFSFQLPNDRSETAHLTLPTSPHLVDARVFLVASADMSLIVEGFDASEATLGNDGRHALLTSKDFLESVKPPPPAIQVSISGMPASGWGPIVAYLSALLIGLLGIVLSATREHAKASSVAIEDLARAKDLLLEELVTLEHAFKNQEIGPKTYAQTRGLLLDALARLEAN